MQEAAAFQTFAQLQRSNMMTRDFKGTHHAATDRHTAKSAPAFLWQIRKEK